MLSGNVAKLDDVAGSLQRTGVPATFKIRVINPSGNVLHTSAVLTASGALGSEGNFTYTVPAGVTTGLTAGADTEFRVVVGIEVIDASYTDPLSGQWSGSPAGAGEVTLLVPPTTLLIENQFASPTGWVKPGETYPFRVIVRNYTSSARNGVDSHNPGAAVRDVPERIAACRIRQRQHGRRVPRSTGPSAASRQPRAISRPSPRSSSRPGPERLPRIPKSSGRTSRTPRRSPTAADLAASQRSTHGPKVIPPAPEFDTSRYGDKPFVIVPVDFRDRKHDAAHTGDALANKVNSPGVAGSTFNLYQEMSYGQLFPNGEVPSAKIASAGFEYEPGFEFSSRDPLKPSCRGTTVRRPARSGGRVVLRNACLSRAHQ